MKRPQFTVTDLLQATALTAATILLAQHLDAWLHLAPVIDFVPTPRDAEMFASMDRGRAIVRTLMLIMGIMAGARRNNEKQYWSWTGAWIGLGIGVVMWIGIAMTPIFLSP